LRATSLGISKEFESLVSVSKVRSALVFLSKGWMFQDQLPFWDQHWEEELPNGCLEPSEDAVQYLDLYVKVEAYWVPEDCQGVILKGVPGQMGHQLARPRRAKSPRSRVPGRGRSQLFLRDWYLHHSTKRISWKDYNSPRGLLTIPEKRPLKSRTGRAVNPRACIIAWTSTSRSFSKQNDGLTVITL
jgi:hypothetical protein